MIYAPLMANPDEVAALLRSGKNVVTPVGWLYPSERSAAPMREAALEGNATLHGTGMAPGGISEKFPLLFSAFSTGVTFVRAEEFSDLRTYEAPDVLRHVMGFGEVPEKALTGPMQKMLDSGFIQAVKMCVDKMGFNADPKVRATQEIAVATAPIDSPLGVIEPGQVAGRKFHWEALVDGEPVVRVTVNWLMGEENLDPAWTFGPAGQRYEMEVRGNPDITIVVKGFHSEIGGEGPEYGIVGTAAHCVNSVPAVCAAEPGILTYLDLPLISGKAAPAARLVSGHDEAVGGRAVPDHSRWVSRTSSATWSRCRCRRCSASGTGPSRRSRKCATRPATGMPSGSHARWCWSAAAACAKNSPSSTHRNSFGYTLSDIKGPLSPLVGHVDGEWIFEPIGSGTNVTWRWTIHPRSGLTAPLLPVFGKLWKGYARQSLEELSRQLVH